MQEPRMNSEADTGRGRALGADDGAGTPRADRAELRDAILDCAVDFAIVATDPQGRITEWNSGAEAVLGWSAVEMLGERVNRIFTPDDRRAGRPEAEMRLALEQGGRATSAGTCAGAGSGSGPRAS